MSDVPGWSSDHLGLLWLHDGVRDNGPRGDAAHTTAAEAAERWHLLARALCISPGLLQLFGLPPHLCLGFSLLGLWGSGSKGQGSTGLLRTTYRACLPNRGISSSLRFIFESCILFIVQ